VEINGTFFDVGFERNKVLVNKRGSFIVVV